MLSLVVDGRQNQESSGDSLLGHSQRLCAHIWRQDVPILPVALSFPSKAYVSVQSSIHRHLGNVVSPHDGPKPQSPTHTDQHVAESGGEQDARDEGGDDNDNGIRAQRRWR